MRTRRCLLNTDSQKGAARFGGGPCQQGGEKKSQDSFLRWEERERNAGRSKDDDRDGVRNGEVFNRRHVESIEGKRVVDGGGWSGGSSKGDPVTDGVKRLAALH